MPMQTVADLPTRRRRITDPVFYVYAYYDEQGNPVYVGKGKGRRLVTHKHASRRGTKLTDALLGGRELTVEKIESGLTEAEAFESERKWIAFFKRSSEGGTLWNISSGGDGSSGVIMSEAAKANLSAARLGKKLTADHRKKLSLAKIGKRRDPASIAKFSATMTGRKRTAAAAANSAAGHRGKKLGPQTPEHIAKAAAGRKGRKFSEEIKTKWSLAAKNRSPSHYVKMAAACSIAIVCVESGVEFRSLTSAAKDLGVCSSAICAVLKGRRNTAGGLTFRYAGSA